jgi:excisionase family DNA binding protein
VAAVESEEFRVIEDAIRQVVHDAVREALAGLDLTPAAAPEAELAVSETHTPMAMSVVAAAERLGLSRSTVYDLIADGSLATLRVGRRRLVTESAIEEFLAGRVVCEAGQCRYCGAPATAVFRPLGARTAAHIRLCGRRGCHEELLDELEE